MPTQTRIADGPIAGTGWYILDNPAPDLIAPGGVVLLRDDTATPHAHAHAAAGAAWTQLRQYQAANAPAARSGALGGPCA